MGDTNDTASNLCHCADYGITRDLVRTIEEAGQEPPLDLHRYWHLVDKPTIELTRKEKRKANLKMKKAVMKADAVSLLCLYSPPHRLIRPSPCLHNSFFHYFGMLQDLPPR